jgi:hypothetical protein
MTSAVANLRLVAASLPCRVLAIAFAVTLFWFFGASIFAGLINPMNLIHFGVTVYLVVAGAFAFIYFFTKRLVHLAVVLPA